MSNPPTLTLIIPLSPPTNIPTIQPPLPTTQTQIEGSLTAPKRLPKRSLFRRNFTWTTLRHNNLSNDDILSPKTPGTEYNLDGTFKIPFTTRRGACVWPKLPLPTDVMQVEEEEEVCEPHPGRRVDVREGEEEQKKFKTDDDEEECMPSATQYHLFLRTTVMNIHPPIDPDKRENLHTPSPPAHLQPSCPPQKISNPLQPPHHSSLPTLPLAREKSNASTASSSSVETFITHVRESFAWRGSRDFAEERREEQEGIFKGEVERGWGAGDGVLESSVRVGRG